MDHTTTEIHQLMDEYLFLNESEENKRRLALWEPEICARDQWHGRVRLGAFLEEGVVPITIDIQHPLWLKIFPQDLSKTFTNPADYLRFYLQKRVTQFKEFQDDTPLEPIIPIWMHTPFEMSLFGMPLHYFADRDPLIDLHTPVCKSRRDLQELAPIDFFKSGLMPMSHEIFGGIKEIVDQSFTVLFPEWTRGPFGVTLYIGGYNDMLMNMAMDPEFFHALIQRVTEERKRYFRARARFLGEAAIPPGSLFNDEVDCGIIGPGHYKEFIKPYEMELSAFHGRISYWHSCGNIWSIAKEVAAMNSVDVLDISGFTDLQKVLPTLADSAPRLDVRLHPIKDLQNASAQWMEQRLNQVIALCNQNGVQSLSIRVSGLNPWKTASDDFEKIRQWISIARRVIDQNVKRPGSHRT